MERETVRVAFFGERRTVSHVRATLSLSKQIHAYEFAAGKPLAGIWSIRRADIVHGVMASSMWKVFRRAKNRGLVTVNHWIGTDVSETLASSALRASLEKAMPFIDAHVAVAPWIAAELEQLGIDASMLPIVSVNLEEGPAGAPERHGVLIYATRGREEFYGLPQALALAREFSSVPFFVCGGAGPLADTPANVSFMGMLDAEAMKGLYGRVSVLLRLPAHDGLSKMVLEALARGKEVIWNHSFPGARLAPDAGEARRHLGEILAIPPLPNLQGRQAVEAEYLPVHAAGRFLIFYEDLLDRRASRG